MSKNIQVGIKVRPLLRKERDQKQQSCWKIIDNTIQLLDSQTEPFCFDHIFKEDASNQIIFDKMAKHIVHSAVQGFNGTIFAYGQTSSGKTYTMMGDEQNPGVMVLAAKEIFKEIEKASERQFLLRVGYIEIYNEKIYDLLNKKNQDLKIHENGAGIVSVNCEECVITCEDELLNHLCMGSKERTVGETNMNERSSRSHAIFRIIIESRKIDRSQDDSVNQCVLNLVDLAGSERADQTGARGTRLKEGGHINKSLLFLSNVIKMLSENNDSDSNKYISYRDSKLTRILQASLGGNALTSIICTIKPTAVEESQSTLSFAVRAKSIKNKPQVNEIVSDAAMMKRLEREINLLKIQLAEERSKNESQIKVGQLEQRIKHEVVKIISCNSLTTVKHQKEQRRRTWCPATSKLEAPLPPPPVVDDDSSNPSTNAFSSQPTPSILSAPNMSNSRLPLPKSSKYGTPLITIRNNHDAAPNREPDISEEVFTPGEICDFEALSLPNVSPNSISPNSLWVNCKTPTANKNLSTISITPKITSNVHSKLELIENELVELKEFTNLENKLDIKHDTHEALKEQLQVLRSRNCLLEAERLEYIELKDEHSATQQKYNECLKHCDDLEIQISNLTKLHYCANAKIANYEEQLENLNTKLHQLEIENRDAISLDFEYQSHKNKSKLRETELLEALSEKDKEIAKLERSLSTIKEEKLQNSKEDLMQLSRGVSESCKEDGQICVKCEDLTRLLEENKKVTNDFEKLTWQYEQLQLNYNQVTADASQVQTKLKDLEQAHSLDVAECSKLRSEIASIREKLEQVQADYTAVSSDNQAKTEAYEALNQVINSSRAEMLILQVKYENLEGIWQQQQKTINDIQTEYDAIQLKYQCLQAKYDQLEHTALSTQSECARLQAENECLQAEINELKQRVEQAQQQLLETSSSSTTKTELAAELAQLKEQNDALQAEHMELQKTYDTLSNQLMDQLQDDEELKNQNNKLEAQLTLLKAKQSKETEEFGRARVELEEQIKCLKSKCSCRLGRDSMNTQSSIRVSSSESMRSSGLGLDDAEFLVASSGMQKCLLQQFAQLAEGLDEIELEHASGQRRHFRAASCGTKNKKHVRCMVIQNIQDVVSRDDVAEDDLDMKNNTTTNGHNSEGQRLERLEMQGSMLIHTFKILERRNAETVEGENAMLPDSKDLEDAINLLTNENQQLYRSITALKEQVEDLNKNNEYLNSEKQALVESTERTINEMREEMTKLTAELFEKSLFVEKCACQDYQKQIESLVRERAEMTIQCEELLAKTMNASNMCLSMNMSMSCTDRLAINRNFDETQMQDVTELPEKTDTYDYDMSLSTDTLHEAHINVNSEAEQLKELQNEIKELKVEIKELQATVDKLNRELAVEKNNLEIKVTKIQELDEKIEDYEQQFMSIRTEHEDNLQTIKHEHQLLSESKEREYNDECNRLQLELMEKLEFNETQGRENLRKYNKEWEQSKERYERAIAELTAKCEKASPCKCAQLEQVEQEKQSLVEDVCRLTNMEAEYQQAKQASEQLYNETLNSLMSSNMQLEIKTKQAQELELRLNELLEQNEGLKNEAATNKKHLLEITDKLQELKQRNDELESEKSAIEENLAAILQERDAALQRAEKFATESNTESQSMQLELLAMKEKLKHATQANQDQLEELEKLENSLKESQLELKDNNNQLENKTEQIRVMQQRLSELLSERQTLMEQIQTLERENIEVKGMLQNIEQNCKQLEEASTKFQQEKTEILKKVGMLQQQLEDNIVSCKCSALETDKQRLQEELTKLQYELISSKQSNEEKQQELETLATRLTVAANALDQVNTMLATKQKDVNSMQLRLDELLRAEQLATQSNTKSQSVQLELEELTKLKNSLKESQLELKDNNNQLENKTEQIRAMQQRLSELLSDRHTLMEQIQTLERENTEVKGILQNSKQLEEASTKFQQEKTEILKKVGMLQQQLEENIVSCKCSALETDNQRLQDELTKLQYELTSTKQSNEEKQQELETLANALDQVNSMLPKQQEINSMQLRLDELLTVQQKLLKQIQELEEQNTSGAAALDQLKKTEAELTTLQERTTTAEQAKIESLKKIETLFEQIQELEALKKTLLTDNAKLLFNNETLQHDNKTLQHKLAKCIEDKQQLEFEHTQLQHEKQIVDKQVNEFDTNEIKREQIINDQCKQLQYFAKLSSEYEHLQKAIATLKQEHQDSLNQLEQEKKDLQLMLNNCKIQQSESEEKLETLQLKIKNLTKDQHDTEDKVKCYEQLLLKYAELEKTVACLTKEKDTNVKKIQHLQEQLQAKNLKVSVAQEKSSVQVFHSKELEQKLKTAQATVTVESARCAELEQNLCAAQIRAEAAEKEQEGLRLQLGQLRARLNTGKSQLQREMQDIHSKNVELQLKCKTLQASNERLQQTNTMLEQQLKVVQQKLASHAALSEEIAVLQTEKQELQTQMTATVEEAGKCTRLLRDDLARHKDMLEQQVEAYKKLSVLLNTKENVFKVEKTKLEGTIECLTSEKKSLNERIHTAEVALKKYDELCLKQKKPNSDSANSSTESNASFTSHSRRSFERLMGENHQLKSININLEDKLMSMQHKTSQMDLAERKSRRLSTHDERRRQSMWVSLRDAETLTDPTDPKCKCVELDKKLKECERNLFIRDCQVANLNMEIKNHPLKAENIALKKRLQDEQEKSRKEIKHFKDEQDKCCNEIKKYKQIIVEQKSRAATVLNLTAAASAAKKEEQTTKSIVHVETQTESEYETLLSKMASSAVKKEEQTTKSIVHVQTQTESEYEASLSEMQGKYNDIKNICRFRHTKIIDLETEIDFLKKNQENSSSNLQISSCEAGRIKVMKQQIEAYKKDLYYYKQKYQDAKILMTNRHAEIKSLRAQLGSMPTN